MASNFPRSDQELQSIGATILHTTPLFCLRTATRLDRELTFEWRNDPWLVSQSPSGKQVDWEDHAGWFSEVLDMELHLLSIVESQDGTGMGTVRLDKTGKDRAIVAISLLRPHVGRGLGVAVLGAACSAGFAQWPWLASVHAYIRKDNQRSLRAFTKAGFAVVLRKDEASFTLAEMVLHRSTWVEGRHE
jgi:UDP-2,4-diacetamido-2,4,6-trideoxy-beta-L-altropyranose hydrolase